MAAGDVDRLEGALGRDPRGFSFGFYLKDVQPFGPGAFYWFSTEQQALAALQQDVASLLDEDASEVDVADKLTRVIDSYAGHGDVGRLRSGLNAILIPDAFLEMLYWGTFDQLLSAGDDWVVGVRQKFREYSADSDDMSVAEVQAPIAPDEIESFVEFLSDEW